MKLFFAFFSFLIVSFSSVALELKSYSAEYKIFRSGKEIGSAERNLKVTEDNHFEFSYKSDISWLIFNDTREELSIFQYTDNKLKPLTYNMTRSGTGPDRKYRVNFDHQTNKLTSNRSKKPIEFDCSAKCFDPMSYHAELTNDLAAGKTEFEYNVYDRKGRLRHYKFKSVGTELIATPFGQMETVKVQRIYPDNKKQAIAWFAPEHQYVMVKFWKGKKGVEQFDIQLSNLEIK